MPLLQHLIDFIRGLPPLTACCRTCPWAAPSSRKGSTWGSGTTPNAPQRSRPRHGARLGGSLRKAPVHGSSLDPRARAFCAQPRAMLSALAAPAPRAPSAAQVPSDSAARLLAPQPPSTQVPAAPAPAEDPPRPLRSRTHLSSLSDMTPAPQRPGSAPRTRARSPTNRAPPPRSAPRVLCACAVTRKRSLPEGGPCCRCARMRRIAGALVTMVARASSSPLCTPGSQSISAGPPRGAAVEP